MALARMKLSDALAELDGVDVRDLETERGSASMAARFGLIEHMRGLSIAPTATVKAAGPAPN